MRRYLRNLWKAQENAADLAFIRDWYKVSLNTITEKTAEIQSLKAANDRLALDYGTLQVNHENFVAAAKASNKEIVKDRDWWKSQYDALSNAYEQSQENVVALRNEVEDFRLAKDDADAKALRFAIAYDAIVDELTQARRAIRDVVAQLTNLLPVEPS